MATYILLANFTEQGIRGVKDTTKRAEAAKEMARKTGATMKEIYWTLGRHDIVAIFDAPDDETMTSFCLSLGMLGNVKTQTLRAFSSTEMKSIVGKLG